MIEYNETSLKIDLQLLAENSVAGIYIIKDNRYAYVNKNVAAYTGYTKEELIGMECTKIVHPEDRDFAHESAVRMLQGKQQKPYSFRIVTKNGETRNILEALMPVTYDSKSAYLANAINVSENVMAIEALHESVRWLTDIINFLPDATLIVDSKRKIISWNRAMQNMTGIKAEEMLGKDTHQYAIPFYGTKRPCLIDMVLAPKETANQGIVYSTIKKENDLLLAELEVPNLPQGKRNLFTKAAPIYNTKGKTVGAIETIRDITDHKRDEKKLSESEELFRSLVDNMLDTAMILDWDGTILFVNKAGAKLLQMESPENIIGSNISDFTHAHSKASVIKSLQLAYRDDGELVSEYKMVTSKGEERWGEGLGTKISFKGKSANLVTLRDITKRKQAEQAFHESESKYRELIQNANSIILRRNTQGDITFFNKYAQKFFGYSEGEIVGKNIVETIVPKIDSNGNDLRKMIHDIGRYPERYSTNENENIRRNGERVWIAWTNKAIRDTNGNIVEILCIGNDVTERKRLKEQLYQGHKMEAIGTLAGGIAHDFNNLLMGIRGRIALMQMSIEPSTPSYKHLNKIEEIVNSAADLTGQLLGFARDGKYETKPTNLNDVITKNSQIFGRTKKEIDFYRKFQPDVWTVEVDRGQIEQVFFNLYMNAWQAMPHGGKVYLETENVVLEDDYAGSFNAKRGPYVKVSITDTGIGMDEETKQRIFEPFFTTKEMGHGAGLGLASVYGIIENHGGFIDVLTKKNHGSTFVVYLPAFHMTSSIEEKANGSETDSEGKTILLIDDEQLILDVGTEILKALGYKVLRAQSGREAIDILTDNNSADMIIMDMVMPKTDSIELIERIKDINAGIKILLSSGYDMNDNVKETMNRGCNGFIEKPFSIEGLANKIKEIFAES